MIIGKKITIMDIKGMKLHKANLIIIKPMEKEIEEKTVWH